MYLTNPYNCSLAGATIPMIWKPANVVAVLKTGRPPDCGSSFRPISLLYPLAMELERLMLPNINDHLRTASTQHGFNPMHSTTSVLLPLSHQIATGFNQRKPPLRTVVLAIDFTKAFDLVPDD